MYEYNAIVTHVVDGDTMDVTLDLGFDILYNSRIRLFGINTPESRTRDLEEKARGLAAKDRVLELCPIGQQVIVKTQKDGKGKYGRILGQFKVYDMHQGKDIILNEWMIENHIGVAYFGQSKESIQVEHLANRDKVNLDVGFMLSEKEE